MTTATLEKPTLPNPTAHAYSTGAAPPETPEPPAPPTDPAPRFKLHFTWDRELVGRNLTEEQAHQLDAYMRDMERAGAKMLEFQLERIMAPVSHEKGPRSDETGRRGGNYPGRLPACPDCGGETAMEEGCRKCPRCGWSSC